MNSDKPIRVAIASDQVVYRRGLASLVMSLSNIQLVGEAENGIEAVQLSALVMPEIVLLDVRGTIESRKELAKEIRKRSPQVKVVVMFDSHEEKLVPPDSDGEENIYFSKDITEEEFIEGIQAIHQDNAPAKREKLPHQEAPLEEPMGIDPSKLPAIEQVEEIRARELVMAGRIQTDILPEKAPSIAGWDIAAKLQPARETSGDFYDFIPLGNNNWGIVIADVTDKGIGAALFMALSSTLIRTYAVRYPTLPALTMDVVNERILSDTRGSMFVTAFFGILEPHTGRIRYVNAGHPPAFLISTQKGKPSDRLSPTGVALGMMENAHWQQKIVRLTPGDVLLLYTDGVTEAQNRQGVFFGEERLLEVFHAKTKSKCSAREIQEAVLSEVTNFIGSTTRQDDIAVIVICRK